MKHFIKYYKKTITLNNNLSEKPDVYKADLHTIRFSSVFSRVCFSTKEYALLVRSFASLYLHEVDCYIFIKIMFKNFVYER